MARAMRPASLANDTSNDDEGGDSGGAGGAATTMSRGRPSGADASAAPRPNHVCYARGTPALLPAAPHRPLPAVATNAACALHVARRHRYAVGRCHAADRAACARSRASTTTTTRAGRAVGDHHYAPAGAHHRERVREPMCARARRWPRGRACQRSQCREEGTGSERAMETDREARRERERERAREKARE